MFGILIALHIIVCSLLIGIILIQAGRGGGLVENFSSVESMFGTKTNAFLTRATAVLSVMFFFTCIGLAVLSVRQSRSLIRNVKPVVPAPLATANTTVNPAGTQALKPLDTNKTEGTPLSR